MNRA